MAVMQFIPLISATIEHRYFADGVPHGLQIQATAETARRLAAPYFAVRADAGRITIAIDKATRLPEDALATPFRFLVWAINYDVVKASEAFLSEPGRVARLTTSGAMQESDGRWRLHPQDVVTPDVLRKSGITAEASPLTPARQPLLELILTAPPITDAPMHCVARLASRAVYWTYYVQGASNRGRVSVVDTDGDSTFQPLGETTLAEGYRALAFRSAETLSLAERSPHRFQLREQNGVGERVLIRRLPSARPDMRPIPGDGDGAMQSEIFVTV